MSLSDLANLGEFLSSIAVLASLIYLAVQVQQAKQNQRASIQAERASRIVDLLLRLGEESNTDILAKGFGGSGISSPIELLRFRNLSTAALYSAEDTFLQHLAGLIDDDEFDGICKRLKRQFSQVGWQVVWEEQRALFSKRFSAFIDGIILEATLAPETDSVADWHERVAARLATTKAPA